MGRDEFLQVGHSPETRHRTLSSPERQVRILGSIVEMSADLLATDISDVLHCGAVGSKPISDDRVR